MKLCNLFCVANKPWARLNLKFIELFFSSVNSTWLHLFLSNYEKILRQSLREVQLNENKWIFIRILNSIISNRWKHGSIGIFKCQYRCFVYLVVKNWFIYRGIRIRVNMQIENVWYQKVQKRVGAEFCFLRLLDKSVFYRYRYAFEWAKSSSRSSLLEFNF